MAERLFIGEAFEKFKHNQFLIAGDLSLSYEDTYNLILQTLPVIGNLPLGKNRFIGIIAESTIHTIVNIFAVFLSGNIAVILSEKEPESKRIKMLKSIGCSTILDKQSIPVERAKSNQLIDLSYDDDATVLFSSGTSSTPKAVLHTYASHYYSALGSNENIELQAGDTWLLNLPLSHVSGLSILYRSLLAGSTIVLHDKNRDLISEIEKHKITHLSLVETQLRELVSSDTECKSLKSVLVGGSAISQNLVTEAYYKKLPLRTTYGSTELASQITTSSGNESLEKLHTSGKLLSYRELHIADDGEILVKGKTLCKKYLNARMSVDSEGWYHTSDIGSLDGDGYLTVRGRKDTMFISGGENIYPEEIESILMESEIFSIAVVVVKEDKKFGNIPVLFYHAESEVSLEMIHQMLSERLPRFKLPREILKIPDEYNQSGIKTDRQYLRNWLIHNQ